MAIAGNPSIPDLWEGNTFALEFRQSSSRSPLLALQYEIDELVSEFNTVAETGKIGIALCLLISNRHEITLPERFSHGPV